MRLLTFHIVRINFILFCIFSTKSHSQDVGFDYILRDDIRFEGIVPISTSSLDLELKSFTINSTIEAVGKSDTLSIFFFNPGLDKVHIRINEIIPIKNYLMKPLKNKWKPGWNKFDDWPADQVIIPKEINISNLGGVGSKDEKFIITADMVPLYISRNRESQQVNSYKIKLLSRETFSIFRYRLVRLADNAVIENKKLRKEFKAGTPIIIILNTKEYEDGEYELWVNGKIKNENNGPERRYGFYHKGKINY